ncbi:MAG: GH25 family lysozyme [Micromonosporaceae bacterium]
MRIRMIVAGLLMLSVAGLSGAAPAASGSPSSARPAAVGDDIGIQATVSGIDVNQANGAVNWSTVRGAGIEWAYLKATEGTTVRDAKFNTYYPEAYYAGVIRGAYHFARPNLSSGTVQADFFASNGGAWSADSRTLPGALELIGNPYSGGYCYGLTSSGMVSWISAFMSQYRTRTGRWAVIHTTRSWWSRCTGNSSSFTTRHPLWLENWSSTPGTVPGGWGTWTFWQNTNCRVTSGAPGCANGGFFNGDRSRLIALANNTP